MLLIISFLLFALHFADEAFGRLETWEVVGCNHNCCVLRDVSCCLLCTVLHDKATETSQVNIFLSLQQTVFDSFHKCLDSSGCIFSCHTCRSNNFFYNVCFCHFILYVIVLYIFVLTFGLANIRVFGGIRKYISVFFAFYGKYLFQKCLIFITLYQIAGLQT